jgi:hypothetical protein
MEGWEMDELLGGSQIKRLGIKAYAWEIVLISFPASTTIN